MVFPLPYGGYYGDTEFLAMAYSSSYYVLVGRTADDYINYYKSTYGMTYVPIIAVYYNTGTLYWDSVYSYKQSSFTAVSIMTSGNIAVAEGDGVNFFRISFIYMYYGGIYRSYYNSYSTAATIYP